MIFQIKVCQLNSSCMGRFNYVTNSVTFLFLIQGGIREDHHLSWLLGQRGLLASSVLKSLFDPILVLLLPSRQGPSSFGSRHFHPANIVSSGEDAPFLQTFLFANM